MQQIYVTCVLYYLAAQLHGVTAQPSSFPSSGVELNHDTSTLPLYPQLIPNSVSVDNKLWCSSSNNLTASPTWKLPGGVVLNTTNLLASGVGQVLVSTSMEGTALGLFPITSGAVLSDGIYKCCITDEQGNEQVLPVSLITAGRTPVISDYRCVQVSTSPLRYSMNAAISNLAPTLVNCINQDGAIITTNGIVSIKCLNDAQFGFGFEFPVSGYPFNVNCTISNGPSLTASALLLCSALSSSINVPTLPSTPQQLLINNNIISTNGFVPSTSITANVPLWCQGSSSSDIITWTLPDGTILTANSGPASGAQVVTAPGQLGLISSGLDDLPSGVYTCTVNGSRSLVQIGTTVEFGAPVSVGSGTCTVKETSVVLCATFNQGLPISTTCTNSEGNPATIQNSLTQIIDSSVPIAYQICTSLNSPTSGDTFTCIFTNPSGSTSVSCGITSLPQVTVTMATRSTPSQIMVTWTSVDSPSLTGYNVTLVGSDGTRRAITVGPAANETTVNDLNPQTSYNVSVTPLGGSATLPGRPSNSITVPASSSPPTRCNPAEGFAVDVRLQRERANNVNCTTIEQQSGFAMAALKAALLSDEALVSNCTNPMVVVKDSLCDDGDKENTPKKGKMEPKRVKKPKRPKRKHDKSKTRGTKPSEKSEVEVLINARVLCRPCMGVTAVRRRDVIEDEGKWLSESRIVKRMKNKRHRKPKNKKPKSIRRSKSRIVQQSPPTVTVNDQQFNVTITERRSEGLFCGSDKVRADTSCDCPSQCP